MNGDLGMWLRIAALLLGGIIASYALIVGKRPDAKQAIDKLVPYGGAIGIALLVFGIYDLFGLGSGPSWFDTLDFFKYFNIWGKVYVGLWVPVAIILGFLLGYSLIDKYVLNKAASAGGKAGEAVDGVGDKAHAGLSKFSGPIGIIALVVGLIMLLLQLDILSAAKGL